MVDIVEQELSDYREATARVLSRSLLLRLYKVVWNQYPSPAQSRKQRRMGTAKGRCQATPYNPDPHGVLSPTSSIGLNMQGHPMEAVTVQGHPIRGRTLQPPPGCVFLMQYWTQPHPGFRPFIT